MKSTGYIDIIFEDASTGYYSVGSGNGLSIKFAFGDDSEVTTNTTLYNENDDAGYIGARKLYQNTTIYSGASGGVTFTKNSNRDYMYILITVPYSDFDSKFKFVIM